MSRKSKKRRPYNMSRYQQQRQDRNVQMRMRSGNKWLLPLGLVALLWVGLIIAYFLTDGTTHAVIGIVWIILTALIFGTGSWLLLLP
jgi:Flp pilus assembly protein TadB